MQPHRIEQLWRYHSGRPIPLSSQKQKHREEIPDSDIHRWMEMWQPGGKLVRLVYYSNTRTPKTDPRVEDLYWRQGGMCPICWHLLDVRSMHLDHDIPLSRGGVAGLWNFQWLCRKCNLSKGKKTTEEFIESFRTEDENQMKMFI